MTKSASDEALAALQTRLGHKFADIGLLRRGLTHPSHVSVVDGDAQSYQRLEFLGDRVLGLVIADLVCRLYPDSDEGDLSRRLTQLVRKETCAQVAANLDFGAAILMGDGEAKSGGRKKRAILGDICESVIAALYLDGGLEVTRRFIEDYWTPLLNQNAPLRDAKTALQEWSHVHDLEAPLYRVIDRTGPDHRPEFTIDAIIEGTHSGRGKGPSKRIAEQEAAKAILVREGAWKEA